MPLINELMNCLKIIQYYIQLLDGVKCFMLWCFQTYMLRTKDTTNYKVGSLLGHSEITRNYNSSYILYVYE